MIKKRIALCQTANELLRSGRIADAESVANEILDAINAPEYPAYFHERGRGLYCAYSIQGIAALQRGDICKATKMAKLAAKSPPSPARKTFGPNMILPSMLLAVGEILVVTEFLNDCRKTWLHGKYEIDLWVEQIEAGITNCFIFGTGRCVRAASQWLFPSVWRR